MNYAEIGTISHGTLRTVDLLESFSDTLETLIQRNGKTGKENEYQTSLVWDAREAIDEIEEDESEPEYVSEILDDLSEALSEYAAPYCYFGAHQGDGSDFGFWPDIDGLEEDSHFGEVTKVSDPSEVESNGTYAFVNDHGNVTLYINGEIVWDCV